MIYSPTAFMFFLRHPAKFFFFSRWFEAWKSGESKTEKSDRDSSKMVFGKKIVLSKNGSLNLTAKGGLLSYTEYQTQGAELLKDSSYCFFFKFREHSNSKYRRNS